MIRGLLVAVTALAGADDPWRLVDASGGPAAGYSVQVVGRTGAAATAPDGTFRLEPPAPLPFDLAVFDPTGTLLGIVRVVEKTSIVLPAFAESIVVREGVARATPSAPASAATTITAAARERTRPERISDVLEEIPGASRLEEGQSVVPVLRGLARGRTLLLLDDARVTAERRAGPSATYLDPASIGSVEVVRGPGSVAYGSDALGGVIHARSLAPDPDRRWGTLDAAAGSGQPHVAGAATVNVPVGRGAILAQARARTFGDYDAPAGRIGNSAADDRGALVSGRFPAGTAIATFGARIDRARDIGKPATDSSAVRAYYPREDSDRLGFGLDLPEAAGLERVEIRAFAGRYRLVTDRDRAATASSARRRERADVDARDLSLRVSGTRALATGFWRAGAEASSRLGLHAAESTTFYDEDGGVASTDGSTSIERASRLDAALFAETERTLASPAFSIAAGGRLSGILTRNEGGFAGDVSRGRGVVSGYVAGTARTGESTSLTLQLARGFREPTLSDRFFRGPSGRGSITGNPALRPETTLQADLALRFADGPVAVAAYAYAYRIEDLIERYPEPDPLDPTASNFFYRNRGREELRGLEVEAEARLPAGLRLRAALGWARGRIADDGSPAADVPPVALVVALEREVGRIWWRARGRVQLRKDDPGAVEVATPGFSVFDLSVGVALDRGAALRVGVDNVLDKSYPASPDPTAVPAPGRALALGVTLSF